MSFDDQPLITNPIQPVMVGNGSVSVILRGKELEEELKMLDDILRGVRDGTK